MSVTDKQRGIEARPHNMTQDFKIDGDIAARSKQEKIEGIEFTSTMTTESLSTDFTLSSLTKVDDVLLNITSPSTSTAGGTVDIGSSADIDSFFDGLDVTSTAGLYRGRPTVSSVGSAALAGGQIRCTGTSTGSFAGFEGDLYVFYTDISE